MKQFDELDALEKKSNKKDRIRSLFSPRNILIVAACVGLAIVITAVIVAIYTNHQEKRLAALQSTQQGNGYTMTYTINQDDVDVAIDAAVDDIIDVSNNDSESNSIDKQVIPTSGVEFTFDSIEHKKNSSNYYTYMKVTNNTDEDIKIHTKTLYLNGYPVDKNRNLGIVPANRSLVLSEITHLDALVDKGMTEIESLYIQYTVNNESTVYDYEETGLSVKIDYNEEDLKKIGNNE